MLFPATCRLASTGERIAAHQVTVHDFDARGIKTTNFGLDEQRALMASLHEISWTGDYLSEIPRTTSGKHRCVIGMTGQHGSR